MMVKNFIFWPFLQLFQGLYKYTKIMIKETVSEISNYSPFIEWNVQSIHNGTLKSYVVSRKNDQDIHIFCLNTDYF